jgi:hypothetical protein
MNIDELEEMLTDILPVSTFKVVAGKGGQIVIYTGLKQDDDGELVDLSDDDELDEEFDSDFEPLEEEDDDEE